MDNETFKELLYLVKDRYTIRNALKALGLSSTLFYSNATKKQKQEIKDAKMQNKGIDNGLGRDKWGHDEEIYY